MALGDDMGTFRIAATFRNPNDRDREQTVRVLVDTGATYTMLPQDIVDALGCPAFSMRAVQLADGRSAMWPITSVLVTLEGQELPTVCLVAPVGSDSLLGAVTLEEFGFSVEPVSGRLVPFTGHV
jgi:clan AA aspartic protease